MISKLSLTEIYRVRSFFFLKVKAEGLPAGLESRLSFYAVNSDSRAKSEFTVISFEKGAFLLRLCVTNAGYNRCLPAGEYRVFVTVDDSPVAVLSAPSSIQEKLSVVSHEFYFAGGKKKYAVFFFVHGDTLYFRIGCFFGEKEIDMGHVNPLSVPDELKKKQKKKIPLFAAMKLVEPSKYDLINSTSDKNRLYNLLCAKYKTKRKKTILFLFEYPQTGRENADAVLERLKERKLDRQFTCLTYDTAYEETKQSSEKIFTLIDLLARSRTIILVDYSPMLDLVELSEDTKVIQLWHGGAGFKSSGYCRFGESSSPSPYNCYRQITYGVAGSEKVAEFHSEVWGINKEQIIPLGMPRMDKFLDSERRKGVEESLRAKYPFMSGKKVILFAPTFRGANHKTATYPAKTVDLRAMYEVMGDEWVMLIKMHPWVKDFPPVPAELGEKIIDVSSYPDINDLFYITDLLITDYSSGVYEFSLMKKPMLFYAFDEEEYSAQRGFHRPYRESAPGKVVGSFDGLLNAIKSKDFEEEKVQKYVDEHFDIIDTGASDRVIDWLILGNLPAKFRQKIEEKEESVRKMVNRKF